MTDKEIIKALECCISEDDETRERPCKGCPLLLDGSCSDSLRKYALDLIKRQKGEIERLEEMLDSSVSSERNTVDNIDYEKTEAIKEFAYLVIEKSRNGVIQISDIPDLVKEMTEGKNE